MSLLINLHHLLKRGKAADSLLSVVLSVRLSSAKLVKHLTCHALKSESSLTGTKRHFLFFLFFFVVLRIVLSWQCKDGLLWNISREQVTTERYDWYLQLESPWPQYINSRTVCFRTGEAKAEETQWDRAHASATTTIPPSVCHKTSIHPFTLPLIQLGLRGSWGISQLTVLGVRLSTSWTGPAIRQIINNRMILNGI